ncbi:uncharacterized protein LOC109825917 isoform X2 [Asparagus officinalis]|nr:uncharacterized protein LOC109825917 isoform X2 [Asparagus officinalis]
MKNQTLFICLIGHTPNLKLLGLLQGFAAGLMLSMSFLDLTHDALNSVGFLKGNIWLQVLVCTTSLREWQCSLVQRRRMIHGGRQRRQIYKRRNHRHQRQPCSKREHRKMESLPIHS